MSTIKLCSISNEMSTASGRTQEIREHLGALGGRDLQLISISLLLLLVLTAGVLALISPTLLTVPTTLHTTSRLLPQLFFGLTTLIVLFNIYILMQKRELTATRRRLVEELIFSERMEAVSLVDPVTQLYNRRAMDQMLSHEVARTNRLGSPLSILLLEIAEFETISDQFGTEQTEQFLYAAAQLVKNTFRGSDVVFRYKQAQFLVVMPDTNEQQVDFAIRRLETEISRHNCEYRRQRGIAFSYGIAEFVHGSRITDTLLKAERRLFLHKNDFAGVL